MGTVWHDSLVIVSIVWDDCVGYSRNTGIVKLFVWEFVCGIGLIEGIGPDRVWNCVL